MHNKPILRTGPIISKNHFPLLKRCVFLILILSISISSSAQKNYEEVKLHPPKTVFDSILVAKVKLTFFQYRNKTYAKAYQSDNYQGYISSADLVNIHTKKFPPIWINGGYAIGADLEKIKKYKKVLSFTWVPIQNKKNSGDVGELRFSAE